MADEEKYRQISARGQDSLAHLQKPLLAMIHGFCIGGGLSIAIGCDLRICSDDSRFGVPAARLGLGYHYYGMEKLMQLVGPAYTKEIFFTARTDFSAQDAWRMGLVNQVVPKAELETFTRNYAQTISRNAPLTISSAKNTVEQLAKPPDKRDTAAARQADRRLLQQRGLPGGRQGLLREAPPAVQGPLSDAPRPARPHRAAASRACAWAR